MAHCNHNQITCLGSVTAYDTAPVAAADRTTFTQTYSTASSTVAALTVTALTVADGTGTNDGTIGAITADASVIAAVQELAAAVNAIRADILDMKKNDNKIIDVLQQFGYSL